MTDLKTIARPVDSFSAPARAISLCIGGRVKVPKEEPRLPFPQIGRCRLMTQ